MTEGVHVERSGAINVKREQGEEWAKIGSGACWYLELGEAEEKSILEQSKRAE